MFFGSILIINYVCVYIMNCCSKENIQTSASPSNKADKDFARVCPSKLSKRELEELYYSLLKDNMELKKTVNKQNEKIKVLSTRLQRASISKAERGRDNSCCSEAKAVVREQGESISELRRANERLAERIKQLNMKLCSAKQFLKRPSQVTPRNSKTMRADSVTSGKNISTSALNPKKSDVDIGTSSASCQYLDKESKSPRPIGAVTIDLQKQPRSSRVSALNKSSEPEKTPRSGQDKPIDPEKQSRSYAPDKPMEHDKLRRSFALDESEAQRIDDKSRERKKDRETPEKLCDENRCRTFMEDLKQKVANLQQELSKTHDEYASRISRLEKEVIDLHSENLRVVSDSASRAHELERREREARDAISKLRNAEGQCGNLATQLAIEKGKVAELETQVKSANMSNEVAKTIEEHLTRNPPAIKHSTESKFNTDPTSTRGLDPADKLDADDIAIENAKHTAEQPPHDAGRDKTKELSEANKRWGDYNYNLEGSDLHLAQGSPDRSHVQSPIKGKELEKLKERTKHSDEQNKYQIPGPLPVYSHRDSVTSDHNTSRHTSDGSSSSKRKTDFPKSNRRLSGESVKSGKNVKVLTKDEDGLFKHKDSIVIGFGEQDGISKRSSFGSVKTDKMSADDAISLGKRSTFIDDMDSVQAGFDLKLDRIRSDIKTDTLSKYQNEIKNTVEQYRRSLAGIGKINEWDDANYRKSREIQTDALLASTSKGNVDVEVKSPTMSGYLPSPLHMTSSPLYPTTNEQASDPLTQKEISLVDSPNNEQSVAPDYTNETGEDNQLGTQAGIQEFQTGHVIQKYEQPSHLQSFLHHPTPHTAQASRTLTDPTNIPQDQTNQPPASVIRRRSRSDQVSVSKPQTFRPELESRDRDIFYHPQHWEDLKSQSDLTNQVQNKPQAHPGLTIQNDEVKINRRFSPQISQPDRKRPDQITQAQDHKLDETYPRKRSQADQFVRPSEPQSSIPNQNVQNDQTPSQKPRTETSVPKESAFNPLISQPIRNSQADLILQAHRQSQISSRSKSQESQLQPHQSSLADQVPCPPQTAANQQPSHPGQCPKSRHNNCSADPVTKCYEPYRDRPSSDRKNPALHTPFHRSSSDQPRTYILHGAAEVVLCKGTPSENTENEISSMTDLPSERGPPSSSQRPPTPLSPGEQKATTTYTDSSTMPTDYASLSEGEIPTEKRGRGSIEKQTKDTALDAKPITAERTSSVKMEETLQAISEELSRCRQLLLQTHRSQEVTF